MVSVDCHHGDFNRHVLVLEIQLGIGPELRPFASGAVLPGKTYCLVQAVSGPPILVEQVATLQNQVHLFSLGYPKHLIKSIIAVAK